MCIVRGVWHRTRGVAYDEGCGIGHACTHSSSSPFPPPAANAGGEPEEAGGLRAEAGSHEKRFVGHLVCSWQCFSGIPKFRFTDESMSWEGGKDGWGGGKDGRQRWCGEEAEMVWGGGRDGVGRRQDGVGGGRGGLGRRQRWCGEEAEMVWQGVTV